MSELRIGVAGGGRMGRERARCLRASGARIVAVYDIEPARGASFAADCATVSVAEFDELLACDAVFLCTPPNARAPMALKCVELGVPFFASACRREMIDPVCTVVRTMIVSCARSWA